MTYKLSEGQLECMIFSFSLFLFFFMWMVVLQVRRLQTRWGGMGFPFQSVALSDPMNRNVVTALCSLRNSEAWSLCCLCWFGVQWEQAWLLHRMAMASYPVFCSSNLSVGSTYISSKPICCLCLVRKVCSDVWPMQGRMVATGQCVKEFFPDLCMENECVEQRWSELMRWSLLSVASFL